MSASIPVVIYGLLAYLAGSVNLTLLVGRALKIGGIRSSGSGNPGVTNLYRTAGLKVAIPVLAADMGKAFLVIRGTSFAGLGDFAPLFALPYVLGNLFPVFHRFKGGKGVAAMVGCTLAMAPMVMLCGGGLFLVVFAAFRRVSAGSLAMLVSYPGWAMVFGADEKVFFTTLVFWPIVVLTHRENIARLVRGKEPGIGSGR